ncbi:hypothetical protein DLAC_10135 [Tieghemostelium lacteum]|uniref:Ribonuclease n=1 Tax=Tieghemostelium lacteum TaxID=361077 RepID=A0A151Z692_TIELA|nr:hypothetical protein DLAC_10135 [Tieghemostelium lacteum]|eukprot:KYQ89465.1 hypothetical protein DLAC_10135 [Tieghemostelium lacteum]
MIRFHRIITNNVNNFNYLNYRSFSTINSDIIGKKIVVKNKKQIDINSNNNISNSKVNSNSTTIAANDSILVDTSIGGNDITLDSSVLEKINNVYNNKFKKPIKKQFDHLNREFDDLNREFQDEIITNSVVGDQIISEDDQIVIAMDEAGKGALIGPLVVSCIVMKTSNDQVLKDLGVKDSKVVTPKKREQLFHPIIDNVLMDFSIYLAANEIDKRRSKYTLNQIEANIFYQLIQHAVGQLSNLKNNNNKNKINIIIDSIENNVSKFSTPFRRLFPEDKYQIICETKADSKYISVGAASILAKVQRDRYIKDLEKTLKASIGSGYPSDQQSLSYLYSHYHKHGQHHNEFRESFSFPISYLQQEGLIKEEVIEDEEEIKDSTPTITTTTAKIVEPEINISKFEPTVIEIPQSPILKTQEKLVGNSEIEALTVPLKPKKKRVTFRAALQTNSEMLESILEKITKFEQQFASVVKDLDDLKSKLNSPGGNKD